MTYLCADKSSFIQNHTNMDKGFNYYRIKTTWKGEATDGSLSKRKTEELVYASSYTEAEKVAHALIAGQQRDQFSDNFDIEIVKTKITSLLYSNILAKDEELVAGLVCTYFEESEESGVGLYGVKVMFTSINEKNGEEKHTHEVIYTPATSNADASERIKKHLGDSIDFVIRDAKFDKAESILWPENVYKQKASSDAA